MPEAFFGVAPAIPRAAGHDPYSVLQPTLKLRQSDVIDVLCVPNTIEKIMYPKWPRLTKKTFFSWQLSVPSYIKLGGPSLLLEGF